MGSGVSATIPPGALDAGSVGARSVDAGALDAGFVDAVATGDGGCGSASVSFTLDVMPIFQTGCTLSSVCHGQMNNAGEEDLYLGDHAGGTSPSAVFGGLVGVRSREDPSMNLVTAGSPEIATCGTSSSATRTRTPPWRAAVRRRRARASTARCRRRAGRRSPSRGPRWRTTISARSRAGFDEGAPEN